MTRVTATVVAGMGELGSEVCARLAKRMRTQKGSRPSDLALLDVPLSSVEDGFTEDELERLEGKLERLVADQLSLAALVERKSSDASPPWLDVIIVGDVCEVTVRRALDQLLDAVSRVVDRSFGHVLGRGGRRVIAIPLLALGEVKGRREPDALDSLLQRLARRGAPRARPFLVEGQTEKYLLTRDELVSSVVAMVELLVLAALRDHERVAGFLRDESPRDSASGQLAPFGSFGIASVRVPGELVGDYCRNRAALAIVDSMRAGAETGLAERETMARELRVDWEGVRDGLGLAARSDAAFEQVGAIVREEAPSIPCPPIEWQDTPELVRDHKFGTEWFATVTRSLEDLVRRLEGRRMPELVDRIDANGLARLRDHRRDLSQRVDEWLWSAPRGWAAALSAVRLLKDEAVTAEQKALDRLAGRGLPERPGVERLRGPVAAVRAEAERRPRPFRLWLTGILVTLSALLFGASLIPLLVYPLRALDAPPEVLEAVRLPYALIWATLLAAGGVAWWLRDHVRARHAELAEVRDALRRSMDLLVEGRHDSILSYYLDRLELVRDAWVVRIARAERRALEGEIARLEEVQRALDGLRAELRAAQRRLGVRYRGQDAREDLSHVKPGGDLITREVASGPLLAEAYGAAVDDEEALATTFFEALKEERPRWRGEVPMADLERIDEHLSDELAVPSGAELLGRGSSPDDPAGKTAREGVEEVLSDLAARLSPALEIHESGGSARRSWVICAPDAAAAVIDDAMETIRREHGSAFASDWLRLASPRDDGRVYLAVLVTHLTASLIGVGEP